jgi:signal transduction histidine kinase
LEDLGLAEALLIYSEEFELRTGIPIHFFTELDMLELSAETSKALYRIYQESLTNVARYADATQVEASLDLEDDHIILSISDNGVGFNTDELIHKKTLGIIGMRERAVMIGGKFVIHSQPNRGTTVSVKLPLYSDIEPQEKEYNSQTA